MITGIRWPGSSTYNRDIKYGSMSFADWLWSQTALLHRRSLHLFLLNLFIDSCCVSLVLWSRLNTVSRLTVKMVWCEHTADCMNTHIKLQQEELFVDWVPEPTVKAGEACFARTGVYSRPAVREHLWSQVLLLFSKHQYNDSYFKHPIQPISIAFCKFLYMSAGFVWW